MWGWAGPGPTVTHSSTLFCAPQILGLSPKTYSSQTLKDLGDRHFKERLLGFIKNKSAAATYSGFV